LRPGDTGRVWLLAYCEHLRQIAANASSPFKFF
jgi:hypothetical protein